MRGSVRSKRMPQSSHTRTFMLVYVIAHAYACPVTPEPPTPAATRPPGWSVTTCPMQSVPCPSEPPTLGLATQPPIQDPPTPTMVTPIGSPPTPSGNPPTPTDNPPTPTGLCSRNTRFQTNTNPSKIAGSVSVTSFALERSIRSQNKVCPV